MTTSPSIPRPGQFPQITAVLQHVFGGQGHPDVDVTHDPFTYGLDWLTTAVNHPLRRLPMLQVYGGPATGKTQFLELVGQLFDHANVKFFDHLQPRQLRDITDYCHLEMVLLDAVSSKFLSATKAKLMYKAIRTSRLYVTPTPGNRVGLDCYPKIILATMEPQVLAMLSPGEHDDDPLTYTPNRVPAGAGQLREKVAEQVPLFLQWLRARVAHHATIHGRPTWRKPGDMDSVVHQAHANHHRRLARVEDAIKRLDDAFDANDGTALIDACSTELEVLISGYRHLLQQLPEELQPRPRAER